MSFFDSGHKKMTYLKINLQGVSGGGKTYSALEMAQGIAPLEEIAFIDTENGSASLFFPKLGEPKYYGVMEEPFSPQKYADAINDAVKAGAKVVVIDSTSHCWKSCLERVELLTQSRGNKFNAWGIVKPEFEVYKTTMLQAPIHVICTTRAKTEYAQEKDEKTGKTVITKLGVNPKDEPDFEYEYTVVFSLNRQNYAETSKDRTDLYKGKIFKITRETGAELKRWIDGVNSRVYNTPHQTSTSSEPKLSKKDAAKKLSEHPNFPGDIRDEKWFFPFLSSLLGRECVGWSSVQPSDLIIAVDALEDRFQAKDDFVRLAGVQDDEELLNLVKTLKSEVPDDLITMPIDLWSELTTLYKEQSHG